MLSITENAAEQLRSLLAEKSAPDGHGLRLSVERGGCAGLQYGMEMGARHEGDETANRDGVSVFVAADSVDHIDGCTLDHIDDLAGAGFKIVNPRAIRSCGCGTSFEAPDAAESEAAPALA